MPATRLKTLAAPLLRWYDTVHADRAMPWRATRDPYAIWLSEIMLQQTQVETVKPYYARFLKKFPTIAALAAAPQQDVLALWAGLGYYRRAKHLHAAAQEVVARFHGTLPASLDQLQSLPGIGRYTAGAIASIAFNLPAPVVDGNVMRVLSRLTAYDQDIAQPKHHAHFWRAAENLLQNSAAPRYGDINQALMELGATLCTPTNPQCAKCPLRAACRAHALGRPTDFPVKAAKKAPRITRLTALLIFRKTPAGTRVLLLQRPPGSIWESLWEFPTLPAKPRHPAAPPDILHALGLHVTRLTRAGTIKHQLTHRTLHYQVLVAHTTDATATLPPCPATDQPYAAARWIPFPPPLRGTLPMPTIVHKIAALAPP